MANTLLNKVEEHLSRYFYAWFGPYAIGFMNQIHTVRIEILPHALIKPPSPLTVV